MRPGSPSGPEVLDDPSAAGGAVPTGASRKRRPTSDARVRWRGGSRRQAVYFIVLAMLLVGVLLVAIDQWRKGLVVMGASILLGGVARAVLPTRLVGWLSVRNRSSDLIFCLVFGVLLVVTAIVARGQI